MKSPNVIEGNDSFNVEMVVVSLHGFTKFIGGKGISVRLVPVMQWKMCSVSFDLCLRNIIL